MTSLPSGIRNFSISPNWTIVLRTNRWDLLRRRPRKSLFSGIGCCLLLVLFSIAGCQSTVSTNLPNQPPAATAVTLSPGDVVKITFPGASELDQSQKIQSDGKINLPLVGEVDAAGRTVADLQRRLQVLYQPQLQNTTVTVTLESSVTQVTVGGAVKKPGNTYLTDRPPSCRPLWRLVGLISLGLLAK